MIPGAVYEVTWVCGKRAEVHLHRERMRFEGTHPNGVEMFAFLDGFGVLPIAPAVLMGATPATESAT